MSAKAEPHLPRELEREILMLALAPFKDYQEITSFMLVARRVRAWFKPLLFAVVNLNHSPHGHAFLRAVEADPTVCADVKHLFIQKLCGRSEEQISNIVHACTSLVGLALDNILAIPFISSVASPHMRYLDLTERVERLQFLVSAPAGIPRAGIAHITHLTLTDLLHPPSHRKTLTAILAALPALTHLSLRFISGLGAPAISFIEETLAGRKRLCLRLLIVRVYRGRPTPSTPHDARMAALQELSKKYLPLAVMLPNNFPDLTIHQWEHTARGESDLWAAGAEFVDRKRRGLVDGE
ncbi:hypothetical protein HMN09_00934300 [Mycena chlorophos]|uniref:Uncharacterized protein n=1 Tax=Mycena chlorophos TaxID=658473 RepID=A0A8H6SJH6_MYCCL|nr:hypothetical protein HMN09_00934300 [Mycena chlorophos]